MVVVHRYLKAGRLNRESRASQTTAVQVLVEGTNSNTASLVGTYAGQIVGHFAAEALQEQQRKRLVALTQALRLPC